jgi:hypothetical protein
MNKIRSQLHTLEFLNKLNLIYICICLYLQYILNSVFTIVFYAMRWKNKISLVYI